MPSNPSLVPNETFTAFVQNAPTASPPGPADVVPIIQGGVTKQIPATNLAGGSVEVTLVSSGSSYPASITDAYIAVNKTPGSATSIVLPSAGLFTGKQYTVADCKGDAGTHLITITAGGNTFDGGDTASVINSAYGVETFTWVGSFWKRS